MENLLFTFPAMESFKGFGLAIAIGVVYIGLLFKSSKSNKSLIRTLGIAAICIFLVNCVADYLVISNIAKDDINVFSVLFLAIFHSLELFVFQTHFFDNGYQEYFFGHGQGGGETFFVYLFSVTFLLACISSAILIIKAFGRRRAGLSWLSANKAHAENTHVFLLGGKLSRILAEDIRTTHPEHRLVLVGHPSSNDSLVELSIWEKIKKLLISRTEEERGPFDAVVFSRIPLSRTVGGDICRQMNLKDLEVFLKTPACKVYLLSDNEEENLYCAELLFQDDCTAEIFCHARREGINRMYEEVMTKTPSMNVHLIDSSFLAVRSIHNCPDLLPVQYVDKGVDRKSLREGWVSSAFNSLILGFGKTGRDVLGFLYEYAAFVDKRFNKSPFSCTVMDRRLADIDHSYRKNYPSMDEAAGISYKECEIGSNAFWKEMETQIQKLNYIVICLGNDHLNLRIAIDLLEFAYRKGKDLSKNFVILITQNEPSRLDEITLRHYNSIDQYHNCIRTFGNYKDVWTYDNMTNDSLTLRAKGFFTGYMRAMGDQRDPEEMWNRREQEIENTPDYALHAKRVRQRTQDYANCFHASTKYALIGPEIYECRREIAQCIPPECKDSASHYTGKDQHVEKVLHYLAVLEHIRWEASHVAMGYTPGEQTDEVKKTHKYIVNYEDLAPDVQHNDYLVIKTTFEL